MAGFSFFREASMVPSGDWVVVGGGEVCCGSHTEQKSGGQRGDYPWHTFPSPSPGPALCKQRPRSPTGSRLFLSV